MSLFRKNAIAISLGMSLVLLHLLVLGDFYLAILSIPVFIFWVIISLGYSILTRKKLLVAVFSAFIPIVTFALIFGSARIQSQFAESNAVKIGDALDQFREKNGSYPATLTALVPDYLNSLPRAGLAVMSQNFEYDRREDQAVCIGWSPLPPFGRIFYWLPAKRWHSLDL